MTTAAEARLAMRRGEWTGMTVHRFSGHVQCNLVVLPKTDAYDFLVFCKRSPKACPVIEVTDAGNPEPRQSAPGADLRTDLPRYAVYRGGKLVEEPTEVRHLWRDDLVSFLLGSSRVSEAATNFTDALRLDPADAAAHLNLGMTLGLLGRRAEAQAHYAEAVRLDPNLAEAHFRLGLELGRQGNDAGAMEQFAEAVRCKPDLLEARLNLAIALRNQRRVEEALAQFHEVLRRNPTNATALEYVRTLRGNPPPPQQP